MTHRSDRQFLIVLIVLTAVVWIYLLVFNVREEMRREFMLDNSGAAVEVYRGRVWEIGKGFRGPTQEEKTFEGERP